MFTYAYNVQCTLLQYTQIAGVQQIFYYTNHKVTIIVNMKTTVMTMPKLGIELFYCYFIRYQNTVERNGRNEQKLL